MLKDELFETGLRIRREMWGPAGAEEHTDAADALDEKFQEMVTRTCFGDVWSRPELPRTTRSLITLAMVIALGRSHEVRLHIAGALANGATEEEIREVLLQSSLYCGIPAAADAFRGAREVFAKASS